MLVLSKLTSPREFDGVPYRYHEDQIAAKSNKLTQPLQFGTQIYSDASSNKKEVIAVARKEGRKVRGDIVKDDSGSYAVFTEQGSSASQMTAAKVMDVISSLPGCSGQAADAVSAYTQVKNRRCTIFIENSKVRMSRYLDTSTELRMAKIMFQYGRPSCSS